MDADYLKLETTRTMTTLRFLAANISIEEVEKLRRGLDEQVRFIDHRVNKERLALRPQPTSVYSSAETLKVS